LPWNSSSHQLNKFLFLADICSKNVLTCGGSTLTSLYTLAVGAEPVEILNKPLGNSLKELPSFPLYKDGKSILAGSWLDNESGDLYSYESTGRLWVPVCNIGCHRILSNGHNSSMQQLRWIKYSTADVPMEPLVTGQAQCRIRSKHVQHFCFKGINTTAGFRVKTIPDWSVNREVGLPISKGVQVLADSARGPVVLSYRTRLMLACDIDYLNPQCAAVQIIISNFIAHAMGSVVSENEDKISLHVKVFGSKYDKTALSTFQPNFSMPDFHDTVLAQPISTKSVATKVKGNLTCVSESHLNQTLAELEPPPPPPLPKYLNINSSKAIETYVQYPQANRSSRLRTIIQNSGYAVNESLLSKTSGARSPRRQPPRAKEADKSTTATTAKRPKSASSIITGTRRKSSTGSSNSVHPQPNSYSLRKLGWEVILYSEKSPFSVPKAVPRIDMDKKLRLTSRKGQLEVTMDELLYSGHYVADNYDDENNGENQNHIDNENSNNNTSDKNDNNNDNGVDENDKNNSSPETAEPENVPTKPDSDSTGLALNVPSTPAEPDMQLPLSPRVRTSGFHGYPDLKYVSVSIARQAQGSCLPVFHPQVGETPRSARRLKNKPSKAVSNATRLGLS